MSLDAALLEAAIRRDDPQAVRDLLKEATEADRRACAKALKDLFKGPGYPDFMAIMMWPRGLAPEPSIELQRELADGRRRHAEGHRAFEEWREVANAFAFRVAVVGLAGGVAAAAEALREPNHHFSERQEQVDVVAAVLADRRPDWLADLIDRNLRWPGFAAWPLARALVRLGAIPRPSVPEYTTLMPRGAQRGEWTADRAPIFIPTPEEALLADPGLLDDEVWRLFTVPDAGRELERADQRDPWDAGTWPAQTWSQALAQLSSRGHLDRQRLIDACLDAFTRDFHPNRVSWYATTLAELDPAVDELSSRSSKYLGLLASTSKTAVTLGQAGAKRMLDAGLLDADVGELLEASAPALLYPQKNIAMAQLKLIDKVINRVPQARSRALAAAAMAFGHQRQDIQEAALALIKKHGIPTGPALDEIRSHVSDLSPALTAQLADLGLETGQPALVLDADTDCEIAQLERRIGALPAGRAVGLAAAVSAVGRGEVPGPAHVEPEAGAVLPPPITDPDELVHLLSALMGNAGDAIAVERALAAAVRLSALPERQRRQAAAPLRKRAEAVMRSDSPFAGDLITSDVALVTYAWAGERLPQADKRRETREWLPHQYAVGGTGRALTMAGVFSARAWEAARLIEAGSGGVLLAEPQTDRGAVSPECLLERIRRLAREGGAPGNSHDHDAAMLRLAPGATEPLWSAWGALAGIAPAALRETYQIVTTPLSFEAVTGMPTADPEYLRPDLDEVLLARTTGHVPTAPDCPSWQLLTRLADPLADYAELTEVARFAGHYDQAVAGWSLICPWQPELAAAHLLRPLSAGLTRRSAGPAATAAIHSLNKPGHLLGTVGHLALVEGLSSNEADTRIAAAELWAAACADGRLDPDLAAAALVTGVDSKLIKLNRVADSLENASHTPLGARRVVETVCAATDVIAAAPPNLHTLIELAARLISSVGLPALPNEVSKLAGRRSRLGVAAAHLVKAAQGKPANQRQAAVQALGALVRRSETG